MKRAARVARAYATASSALPRAPDDPTAPARHAPSDGRTAGTPPTPFGDGKSAGLPGKLDSRHPVSHWSAVGPRGAGIRRSRSAANRAPRSPSSRPSRTVPRRAGWPGSGRGVGGAAAPDAVHLPVGCQNAATARHQRFQAAISYSLRSPPRIGRRRILPWTGSGIGDVERGGRNRCARCGRAVL